MPWDRVRSADASISAETFHDYALASADIFSFRAELWSDLSAPAGQIVVGFLACLSLECFFTDFHDHDHLDDFTIPKEPQ